MKFLFSQKGWMSTFLLIFIISSFSYAQIVIEERIDLNPTPNIFLKPLAQHLIRIDLQWTPADIPAAILIYDESNQYPCRITGGSGFQTSGFISYQQEDVLGGHYNLQFRSNGPCTPPNTITAQYSVYFDNNLLKSGSFTLGGCYSGGSYPYNNEIFVTPLKTDYSFNIYPAFLCMGKGTNPAFSLGRGCTNVEIDTTTEMVNLQILSGGEYTSFYGYQGMVTDNLTVPYSELNTVELKQDQFFSGSETTVLVQSNLSGIIKQDSIIAYPKSSYGINASPVLYPIFYGQTIVREVRQYGPGGCSAIFPADIKLNAVITDGNESGHLKDFNNGTTGDTLTNITFRSFGGNLIGFVADGIKKDMADTVIVMFSTTDPEINTVQLSIIINPDPLYVAIEPDILAPGDTATVVIKSRLEDGTLEDFPPEQTFEVGMLEGCTLGNIIADGDTAQYLYEVMQPIKFVAVDSLEKGGGTVKLIVGLVEEYFPSRPVSGNEISSDEKAYKEKESEIFSENENTNVNKEYEVVAEGNNTGGNGIIPDNPTGNFCFLDPIQSFTTQEAEFVVGDGTLDHFAITIIPDTLAMEDTLAFAETAKLIIQAKDADDNDVELEGEKLLTFKVETNENYGTFIDVNGDTLKSSPVVLSNITYQNAKDGLIKFAAVKANPDSVLKCLIKVVLEEDTTKTGEREAVVLEQTLKIEMDEPYTVYPTYFNSQGVRVYNEQLSRKTFDVTMTRGGEPVSDHPFKLFTNNVDGSGGHDHTNQRPNNNNNYGYFLKPNDTQQYRPLEDSTSSLGRFDDVTYVASYFGDTMRVYLESLENKIFLDSVSIVEMIPDLQILPNSIYYTKIGGTQAHHGPPLHNNEDHNHWGTHDVNTNLLQIAIEWNQKFPQEDLVQINDISLFLGGLFDVTGNWNVPHRTHRRGLDVDIRTEFPNQRSGIPIRDPRNSLNLNHIVGHREFEEICRIHGFEAHIHGTRGTTREHYHLDYSLNLE